MDYRKISLIVIFCFACSQFLGAQSLTVKLEKISSSKGKMMLALYNRESGFPGTPKSAFRILQVPANKPSVVLMFDQIPPGTYALAVFHDINEDGELNTNLLGVPKEGYGFSNNARASFRAPTFNEAAFEFSGQKSISVVVR